MVACQDEPVTVNQEDEAAEENSTEFEDDEGEDTVQEDAEYEEQKHQTVVHTIDDKEVVKAVDLADALDGEKKYDDLNRTLTLEKEDEIFEFVYGVPVFEHNGEYPATEEVTLILEDETPYLPVEFLEKGLGTEYEIEDEVVQFQIEPEVVPVSGPEDEVVMSESSWDAETMIDYLSFLHSPIDHAEVSTVDSHLPGAERAYRNGVHEGIDWYDYASGVEITTDTPIYGMAEGKVVRVDHDFEEYSSVEERLADLDIAAEAGETPEYILDRLRGKQVWVQYDNGVMNRFAHLDSIPEGLELGESIDEHTVIGYVGNTGTSASVANTDDGLHLHHDLLIYGDLFFEPLTEDETIEVLQEIFKPREPENS